MPKPKILLSAFEPFGGESDNSSQQVANYIRPSIEQNWEVNYRLLPVTQSGAASTLIAELDIFNPDIVLLLGQAGKRRRISPERVAINLDSFHIPDNAGEQPLGQSICADGPVGYFSTLPIHHIVSRLKAEGIAVKISNTAGLYVCNHVFYAVMHHVAHMESPPKAGLIHLPRVREPNDSRSRGLTLETMGTAVELAMAECVAGLKS